MSRTWHELVTRAKRHGQRLSIVTTRRAPDEQSDEQPDERLALTARRYVLWLRLSARRDRSGARVATVAMEREERMILAAHDAQTALAEALDLFRQRVRDYVIERAELRVELDTALVPLLAVD